MTKLIQGSAQPAYLIDPSTRQPLRGSAIPVYLVDVNGNFVSWSDIAIGNVTAGNYVRINEDGVVLYGDATAWDDLRIPASATKVTGASQPAWAVIPGTTNIYTWFFGAAGVNEAWFVAQMPHSWKEGSNISPHVHWVANGNGGVDDFVKWVLEYTWVNIGAVVVAETPLSSVVHTPADASIVAGKHYLSEFADINGAGKTLSSMLACRLYRDGANDDYANTAGLLELDFHYEVDSFGSREEYVK